MPSDEISEPMLRNTFDSENFKILRKKTKLQKTTKTFVPGFWLSSEKKFDFKKEKKIVEIKMFPHSNKSLHLKPHYLKLEFKEEFP